MKHRPVVPGLLAAAAFAACGWSASAQIPAESGPVLAHVGRLTIARAELADRFEQSRSGYLQRTGEAVPEAMVPTFRRTVLEQLIRARLLMLEAERQGELVPEAEAEAELKRSPYFQENGRFVQAKFDAARRNDPQGFARALADARLRLSGARLEPRIVRQHQPDDARLRADIERELTTATLEVLALPFDRFDGRGVEPTEREVLDAYAARVARGERAPLASVAKDLRDQLRIERRAATGDRGLNALYEQLREEFRRPAARVRYAFFDTSTIRIGAPSEADLERYYRGHLADYASFDPGRGEIRQRELAEVREDVRLRWAAERRAIEARAAAGRLVEAWERGRRDRRAEGLATLVRETPRAPAGYPVDTLGFGALLGDTIAARGLRAGPGMVNVPGGVLAFHIFDFRDDHVPPLEAVRSILEARYAEQTALEDLNAARRLFDANPAAFARDSTVHFTRVVVALPAHIDVPLTRQEVERHHRENIHQYSAPEVMAARHILFVPAGPTAEDDRAARERAFEALRRVRAGEDFATLARELSDDDVTRANGGDLGSFGRGVLHPAFERAVFELRPGDTSEPVRTSDGYHLIHCTAYEPMFSMPLVEIYSTVGWNAAAEKAKMIAFQRAESLLSAVRTPQGMLDAAQRLRYVVYRDQQPVTQTAPDPELAAYFRRLGEMKPGEIYPLPVTLRGQGYVISWVDSITPPVPPRFDRVEQQALAEHRRRMGQEALDAKRAELDRMEHAGWALDSLAALFGGLERHEAMRPGTPLPVLGGDALIDSLVFGSEGSPALRPGETSGWVAFPGGLARVRLVERTPPAATEMATRLDLDRRRELERNLFYYYERLKREHAVRINDRELAAITLPPPQGRGR